MKIWIRKLNYLILAILLMNSSDARTRREIGGTGKRFSRAVKAPLITPLQYFYMTRYYNPFWYGGPLDGGDKFDGPFGGFAPNPFARPTAPPKSDKSTTAKAYGASNSTTSATTPKPPAVAPPPLATMSYPPMRHPPYTYHYNSYDFEYDAGSYAWNEYE